MIAYMESLYSRHDYQPPLQMIWQYRLQMCGYVLDADTGVRSQLTETKDVRVEFAEPDTQAPAKRSDYVWLMVGC